MLERNHDLIFCIGRKIPLRRFGSLNFATDLRLTLRVLLSSNLLQLSCININLAGIQHSRVHHIIPSILQILQLINLRLYLHLGPLHPPVGANDIRILYLYERHLLTLRLHHTVRLHIFRYLIIIEINLAPRISRLNLLIMGKYFVRQLWGYPLFVLGIIVIIFLQVLHVLGEVLLVVLQALWLLRDERMRSILCWGYLDFGDEFVLVFVLGARNHWGISVLRLRWNWHLRVEGGSTDMRWDVDHPFGFWLGRRRLLLEWWLYLLDVYRALWVLRWLKNLLYFCFWREDHQVFVRFLFLEFKVLLLLVRIVNYLGWHILISKILILRAWGLKIIVSRP